MKEWQAYALAAFAVFAGQILRVGQKIEAGKPISWRDIFVMCSLMPAFESMAGAAAVHFGWPAWSILVAGTSAGWVGFGTMRFVLVLAKSIAGQLSAAKVD
ncbi:hypothetical protein [Sphingomonas sp. PP-CE-1G-424]|uniref:hypothetical protein n=1 Tax=Sphingomonas sp. PP-CE-1G-424 TaxID=2135658 RepID=UPI0010567671|nr:hypothetical protein [Sphingomonas sp. PP-CE-1G-424]TCP71816.1 hypothetical protein C8J43_102901 [Sphingomonas sp. PP-CE-1G-424]